MRSARGRAAVATASLLVMLERPLHREGQAARSRAARDGRRASPPRAARAALRRPTSSSRPGSREIPHHVACLIGYGATAVYPYLVYQSLHDIGRAATSTSNSSSAAAIAAASARVCSRSCRRWVSRRSRVIAARSYLRSSASTTRSSSAASRARPSRIRAARVSRTCSRRIRSTACRTRVGPARTRHPGRSL